MKKYGLAIDIGTTTITAGLIDLAKKKEIAVFTRLNPQGRFGEDIVSRLAYCVKDKNGLADLHGLIIKGINSLINRPDVEKIAAVGNAAMEHFFLGVAPDELAEAPYVSTLPRGLIKTTAGKIGLAVDPRAAVYLLPMVKSFVGSDLTAGVLYTGLLEKKGANLLIDIGTNGEIALAAGGKFFVTSTAAGPAFETGIKGMRGSDVIEAVAFMLKNGIIDRRGSIKNIRAAKMTQADVRKVQLAKAAILAGAHTLLKKAGIDFKDIANLYVAGKFGNYINKKAAVDIGLLPRIKLSRIKPIGNAAYKGAVLALCSEKLLKKSEGIAKKAVHLSLFGRKDFKEEFVRHMSF